MRVSIIIPVYNELPTLPEVLRRVHAAILPPECTREIIVVDDGSTDGTHYLIENYVRRGLLLGFRSDLNRGKGAAIREGIRHASGQVILIQDGDLEYDPSDYIVLLAPLLMGLADVVYGSRFMGKIVGMTWKSRIANKILTFSTNCLYGTRITDEATAYKAFRTDLLSVLKLSCQRFDFCPEVTAKLSRLGYKIHEVPIKYCARSVIEGKKVRIRDGFEGLWTLIKYRFAPMEGLTSPFLRTKSF
jgi:glycosyltransferase involved in cell wall biosynthesis